MTHTKVCPLCGRDMPEGSYNAHHLIPATFKGKQLIDLHYICHSKIHHTFADCITYAIAKSITHLQNVN